MYICDLERMIRGPIYIWGLGSCVADRHHFDADPDTACHFDAAPDPTFHFDADPDTDPSFRMKAQTLKKSAQIGSYSIILACHLQIDADPDPLAPTFQFDAYPCGSGSKHCLVGCRKVKSHSTWGPERLWGS